MFDAEGRGLLNLWVRGQNIIDLLWDYFFASSIDFLFDTAFEEEITIRTEIADVSRVKPAVTERLGCGFLVTFVAATTLSPRTRISPVSPAESSRPFGSRIEIIGPQLRPVELAFLIPGGSGLVVIKGLASVIPNVSTTGT